MDETRSPSVKKESILCEIELDEKRENMLEEERQLLNYYERSQVVPNARRRKKDADSSQKDKPFRHHCPDCYYKSNHTGTFKRHTLTHLKRKFCCHLCSFKSNQRRCFTSHMQKHVQFNSCVVKVEPEPETDSSVSKKKSFNIYYPASIKARAPERDSTGGPEVFRCFLCSFSSTVKGNLRLHCLIHKKQPFACKKCDFVTGFKNLLKAHEQTHPSEDATGLTVFNCHKCNYSTNVEANMIVHSAKHMEMKRYSCSHCSYYSYRKDITKKHEATHNPKGLEVDGADKENNMYECLLCNFKATVVTQFDEHLLEVHQIGASANHINSKSRKSKGNTFVSPPRRPKQNSNAVVQESKKCATAGEGFKTAQRRRCSDGAGGRRKNMNWPLGEKLEIYWCNAYSNLGCFEKWGAAERRRKLLKERAIIDPVKIDNTPDSRLHNIIANLKMGKCNVALDVLRNIEEQAYEFAKKSAKKEFI